jgi:hypothetical protein
LEFAPDSAVHFPFVEFGPALEPKNSFGMSYPAHEDIGCFLKAVETIRVWARIFSSHYPGALVRFHTENFLTAQSGFHNRKSARAGFRHVALSNSPQGC